MANKKEIFESFKKIISEKGCAYHVISSRKIVVAGCQYEHKMAIEKALLFKLCFEYNPKKTSDIYKALTIWY